MSTDQPVVYARKSQPQPVMKPAPAAPETPAPKSAPPTPKPAPTLKPAPPTPEPTILESRRKRNPPKWTENMVMDFEGSVSRSNRNSRTSASRKTSADFAAAAAVVVNANDNITDKTVLENSKNTDPTMKSISTAQDQTTNNVNVTNLESLSNGNVESKLKNEKIVPPKPKVNGSFAGKTTTPKGKMALKAKTSKETTPTVKTSKEPIPTAKTSKKSSPTMASNSNYPKSVGKTSKEPTTTTSKTSTESSPIIVASNEPTSTAMISKELSTTAKTSKGPEPTSTVSASEPPNIVENDKTTIEKKLPIVRIEMSSKLFENMSGGVSENSPKRKLSNASNNSSTKDNEHVKDASLDVSSEPSSKRIRQSPETKSVSTPPKIDLEEPTTLLKEHEKVKLDPISTSRNGNNIEVTPTMNGTSDSVTHFVGMPKLLSQTGVPVVDAGADADNSSDSDDEKPFLGFKQPPAATNNGRRNTSELYIKDIAIGFLKNKISNRNMLRIRNELMTLKQSGNYFKLTKTAPLAAGLVHDMFCQMLDPSQPGGMR